MGEGDVKGGKTFAERMAGVSKLGGTLLGLVPIATILLVWWFVTRGAPEERIVSIVTLPSPGETIDFIPRLFEKPDAQSGHGIWAHAGMSFRRVGLGFLIALLIALPFGALIASFSWSRAMFAPVVTSSGYIPLSALVPLSMLWFGIGENMRVYFLAICFTIYLLPLVVRAMDGVSDVYIRTAYTLGASRWQVIRRVLIAIALPDIWHSMRLAFGIGWTYLVLVEVIVLDGGLGYLIGIGQRRGELRPQVYIVIILITLIAWVVDFAWARVGRMLFPYRVERS